MIGLAEAIFSKEYMRRIPWSLIVKHKIKRKVISSEFLTCLKADRQAFFSWIVNSRWNVSLSFWTGHEKTILGMAKPSASEKKNFRKWLSAGKVVIAAVWDREGAIVVDVMPRCETAYLPRQIFPRAWEVFEMSWALHESGINLASTWECKATYQFEGSWSHHKIWLEIFTPSVLRSHCHPHISTCLEQLW